MGRLVVCLLMLVRVVQAYNEKALVVISCILFVVFSDFMFEENNGMVVEP